ncbi:hypothetical protein NKH77_28805 [Streptomyces sp. M19]
MLVPQPPQIIRTDRPLRRDGVPGRERVDRPGQRLRRARVPYGRRGGLPDVARPDLPEVGGGRGRPEAPGARATVQTPVAGFWWNEARLWETPQTLRPVLRTVAPGTLLSAFSGVTRAGAWRPTSP